MKKNLITAICITATLLLGFTSAVADDLAVMKIKVGNEKELQTVVIDLFEERAPQTVENFKKLAKKGFYKKQQFHRVFPGYLVQTGDPQSKKKDRSRVGTGGPGYTIPAEQGGRVKAGSLVTTKLPKKLNPAEVSNGSQFFIALQAMPDMNGKETVFGEVVQGLEVLDAISRKSTDSNDFPVERIYIRSIKMVPASEVVVVDPGTAN